MIIGDILEHNAMCFGPHPAICFEGETLTHAQLADRVKRLIGALMNAGMPRQARLAVLSRNTPEYLEVYGAAGLGGFIGLGINYRLSDREQLSILQDAEPAVLFFEDEFASRVEILRAQLPDSMVYIRIRGSGQGPAWSTEYEDFIADCVPAAPGIRASEDDVVFIIYTSGTTGKAKGAMLGNEAQLEQARVQALSHTAAQTDRMLIVMPFYHIGGPTELLTFLYVGATIVLHRDFDARAILESIESERVTAAHLAPTMIQMMLEIMEKRVFDVSSLRTVCYASAPMSEALSRRACEAFGSIFMQIYGMTENGLGSVLLKHQHVTQGDPAQVRRLASAGQPYLGTDIRTVRADGSDCATGECGDIWIKSKSLMQGYWKNPVATQEALVDGWFLTGDIGYFDAEHFLFVVDRKKDMIVSGGENIYSREVEEALLLHPAVLDAAVIGVPDPKWGESVMAFIVTKPGHAVSQSDLIAHCRGLIGSYKKPTHVEFLDQLPRLVSTRKVDKKALRAPFWASQDRQVS
ncbi:MAG TPA: AMP-binding protein [Eoetvoesiella sp.]|uniref:class I adenylate-forming enzyme family protein n=1 Tax=Eoetvoesiella sp. TaxID=1966355 RepID=UPI002B58276E|nr:AMP-binding protein [Eoetvoesiella sp.]HWK61900.1 AMP-binding protein [Eoetvoesiella sp.]